MNTFILIFRMDITSPEAQPSPEQMETYMQQWQEWTDTITVQNKMAGGNHLSTDGCVLRPNNSISTGPYTQNKESVAGYILITANDMDEALNIAQACPILQGEGTSVEVRQIAGMEW